MEITWLSAERVEDLNRVALYEGEPHGRNPGSDLEAIVYRPQSWAHYEGVHFLYKSAGFLQLPIYVTLKSTVFLTHRAAAHLWRVA